jgi:UDP-4-amino-4,6-dideoxy-N-acetyl-beta-L-altrosamine N-acetyltransferase
MEAIGKIRDIKPSELELMLDWRNAPQVRRNMYNQHIIGLSEHLIWWRNTAGSLDKKYFMYERGGLPAGIVGFTDIDQRNKNTSWAFYSSPEAPQGTGSRMEYLALNYAFEELHLHKVSCEVLAFNSSVIKLHEKFGFSIEGVFREHYKIDDEYVDIYRLGLMCGEWSERSGKMLERLMRMAG